MHRKRLPECPFCKRYIAPPEDMKTQFGEISGGKCYCGSVYVYDRVGHNMGQVFLDALYLAKGDWNIDEMTDGVDYETQTVGYDLKTQKSFNLSHTNTRGGRLIFVKIIDENTMNEETEPPPNITNETMQTNTDKKDILKDRLIEALNNKKYLDITEMTIKDKGSIRRLISLTYDKDTVLSWRAIEALGVVSHEMSKKRVDVVRDTIRRLLWYMTEESGGIGWSSPEIIGEIIRANPDEQHDIIPILWSQRSEEMFRAGVMRAMWRIAETRPDLVSFVLGDIDELINDANPYVRLYVCLLSLKIGDETLRLKTKFNEDDATIVKFYYNEELSAKTVGDIIRCFLEPHK